jgi:hypothetical protein
MTHGILFRIPPVKYFCGDLTTSGNALHCQYDRTVHPDRSPTSRTSRKQGSVPGKRNLARERLEHQRTQPHKQLALYNQLRTQLPSQDRALVGYPTILAWLHTFGLRRRNNGPLTQRMVQRWVQSHGFPVARGNRQSRISTLPVTSSHALTAWILTQFDTATLYHVAPPQHASPKDSFPLHALFKWAA